MNPHRLPTFASTSMLKAPECARPEPQALACAIESNQVVLGSPSISICALLWPLVALFHPTARAENEPVEPPNARQAQTDPNHPPDTPDDLPESAFVSVTRLPDDPNPENEPEINFHRLPPRVDVQTIHTGPEGVVTAAPSDPSDEKLVYSNTLGKFAFALPENKWVSDDITTLTPGGCKLKRYSFQVVGKAIPSWPEEGTYFIEYGLFDNCPYATGPDPEPIPGTRGTLLVRDDSSVIDVHFAPPPDVEVRLPPTVWLGVKPNRQNVGFIGGAPTRMGFSQDLVDFPGSFCNADAGGFPFYPHASFNAQLFVDESCPSAYPAYQNLNPARSGLNAGVRVCFSDDLELNVPDCNLTAYELSVRLNDLTPSATVQTRLFRDADGLPGAEIPGTVRAVPLNAGPGSYRVRINLTDPIPLHANRVWVAYEAALNGAGWILTRKDASVGRTGSTYARSASGSRCSQMVTSPDWEPAIPRDSFNRLLHGGFDVTLYCDGDPPKGACCDMYLTDDGVCDSQTGLCVGGEYDGDVCYADIDCKGDPQCLDLPEMNCPFPPRNSSFLPKWQPDKMCRECTGVRMPCETSADCIDGQCTDLYPFGTLTPCGISACCVNEADDCRNLTEKECWRQPPTYVSTERWWQIGRYCRIDGQRCPPIPCLRRKEPCDVAHHSYCEGGPFAEHPCEGAEDCVWPCAKACIGENAGRLCRSDLDCGVAGQCRRHCLGGPHDGEACSEWDDCSPPGVCLARESSVCAGGVNEGELCMEHRDCPLGGCSDNMCFGGARDGLGCARDFDCRAGICRGIPGCENPLCCSEICQYDPDPQAANCCTSNWSQECADLYAKNLGTGNCFGREPFPNDECPYAQELQPELTVLVDTTSAYALSGYTSFCCGGGGWGRSSRNVAWYKFIATESSARISACHIGDEYGSSIIQAYGMQDNVNPHRACESLRVIACSDESSYCGDLGDSSLCLTNLKPGKEYYVVLTASPGLYEITLEPGCDEPSRGCPDRPEHKPGVSVSETKTIR